MAELDGDSLVGDSLVRNSDINIAWERWRQNMIRYSPSRIPSIHPCTPTFKAFTDTVRHLYLVLVLGSWTVFQ